MRQPASQYNGLKLRAARRFSGRARIATLSVFDHFSAPPQCANFCNTSDYSTIPSHTELELFVTKTNKTQDREGAFRSPRLSACSETKAIGSWHTARRVTRSARWKPMSISAADWLVVPMHCSRCIGRAGPTSGYERRGRSRFARFARGMLDAPFALSLYKSALGPRGARGGTSSTHGRLDAAVRIGGLADSHCRPRTPGAHSRRRRHCTGGRVTDQSPGSEPYTSGALPATDLPLAWLAHLMPLEAVTTRRSVHDHPEREKIVADFPHAGWAPSGMVKS